MRALQRHRGESPGACTKHRVRLGRQSSRGGAGGSQRAWGLPRGLRVCPKGSPESLKDLRGVCVLRVA